jgi:hypothetical protein
MECKTAMQNAIKTRIEKLLSTSGDTCGLVKHLIPNPPIHPGAKKSEGHPNNKKTEVRSVKKQPKGKFCTLCVNELSGELERYNIS